MLRGWMPTVGTASLSVSLSAWSLLATLQVCNAKTLDWLLWQIMFFVYLILSCGLVYSACSWNEHNVVKCKYALCAWKRREIQYIFPPPKDYMEEAQLETGSSVIKIAQWKEYGGRGGGWMLWFQVQQPPVQVPNHSKKLSSASLKNTGI